MHVTTLTFANRGIGVRFVFSLGHVGKQIRWRQSKRLVSGSLVALTPTKDMFKTTCIVAMVAARPIDLVEENPPKIDLFFARPEDIPTDPAIEYTMIEERTSYFEAVRHNMLSLQKMSAEPFPLAQHIIGVETHVKAPVYVKNNPEMNLGVAFESDIPDRYADVDILKEWPTAPQTTLDASQLNALRHILSKRVAIVSLQVIMLS